MDEDLEMACRQQAAVPAADKERAGYDRDFYTWSQEQGRLVREGRWSDVDRENVVRVELDTVLSDNPGLRSRVGEALERAYRRATIEAAKETGVRESSFAKGCPYSFDAITSRPFEYE